MPADNPDPADLLLLLLLLPFPDEFALLLCECLVEDVDDEAVDLFDDFKLLTFDDC